MNCFYTNCLITEDRSDLINSDAILFHWIHINVQDLPKNHSLGPKWVLFNWEPPYIVKQYAPSDKTIMPLIKGIDWTMTYKKSSDIYSPYGFVKKCDKHWNNEDLFDKKTKSIAWMVSGCETSSKREVFVKELSNYIDIDIYGKCGKYKCKRDANDTCFQMIANTYKFYLSFENSVCKDYVTEKLFRTLSYDIIPIVYGGADYKQIAPNNSFINAMDFPSAKELSEYLKTISKDKQKYNSYLKWKSSYCIEKTGHRYLCDLCEKLNHNYVNNQNNNSHDSKPSLESNKTNLFEWWFNDSVCQHPIKNIV